MTMTNIIGEARKLIDLVNYQDSSIVSKEIIKNEKGTVTLFAFDKGQGLSEHTAPFDALVYNFDGKAEVIIGGLKLSALGVSLSEYQSQYFFVQFL